MAVKVLRQIADPFVVAAPCGRRIRTRLRLGDTDELVVSAVGEHLGRLASADLAARLAGGAGAKHAGRAARKKALTSLSSSRWAGSITRTTADQWARARENMLDERASLRSSVAVIDRRLAVTIGARRGRVKGYHDRHERAMKQRRLQALQGRLRRVESAIADGNVSVCRGGKRLFNMRRQLAAAGLSQAEWVDQWKAARWFLTADGEADKTWGNETIRVNPEQQWCEIRLPTPLAHLSNTAGPTPTYRLGCSVEFHHLADAWAAQAASGAVAYTISFDPGKHRWYLDASWTVTPTPLPVLDELRRQRTLGVDLNADHLAAWVVTPEGNPLSNPITVRLSLAGLPASTRDGRLRAAISELLDAAESNGCASISIENLNFADARTSGRETMGRGRRAKQFRRTVAGIPTARFRDRLTAMATNRGLAVVAVDPAYTSRWGAEHWRDHLDTQTSTAHPVTRHHSASFTIARRSYGHRARRRSEKPAVSQRTGSGEPSTRPNTHPGAARNPGTRKDTPQHQPVQQTAVPEWDPLGNQAPQNRSGTPTEQLPPLSV